MSTQYPKGKHPNSLKHLTAAWNSETAKEAQLLGAAKKKANRLAREQLKMTMAAWKDLEQELKDEHIDSVSMLKVVAWQALEEGDKDTFVDIMKSVAEFEKPKLARVESKVEEVKTDALSDEELAERIAKAMKED